MIEHEPNFGTSRRGESVDAYTLATSGGRVRILTFGGTISHLLVPDRNGQPGDVTLGYDDLAGYDRDGVPYFGCAVGRVANRIRHGRFTLDGQTYQLNLHRGPHHLHGGPVGYGQRVWRAQGAETPDGPAVAMTLHDPDGFEHYPGALDVTITYTMTHGGALRLDYAATAGGRATPVNLTNHAFFNLRDGGATPISEHVLTIDADRYTPTADTVPTGEVAPVTPPLDFRAPGKPIGRDVAQVTGGYDVNYILRDGNGGGPMRRAARVVEPVSGRTMECWTTEPALQFYGGQYLNGTVTGKLGRPYEQHAAFCLESQRYPDSVNHPNFPSIVLLSGETYRSRTEYRFGIE